MLESRLQSESNPILFLSYGYVFLTDSGEQPNLRRFWLVQVRLKNKNLQSKMQLCLSLATASKDQRLLLPRAG
jgi:hypothetical protein